MTCCCFPAIIFSASRRSSLGMAYNYGIHGGVAGPSRAMCDAGDQASCLEISGGFCEATFHGIARVLPQRSLHGAGGQVRTSTHR